jgi:hypothetical protein
VLPADVEHLLSLANTVDKRAVMNFTVKEAFALYMDILGSRQQTGYAEPAILYAEGVKMG